MNPVEQVHVHAVLPTFDVTDAAWLLQFFFFFTSRLADPDHRCRYSPPLSPPLLLCVLCVLTLFLLLVELVAPKAP